MIMFIPGRKCDIIFLDSETKAGKLVKWWTNSMFDHVEICLGDRKVIGARPNDGVKVRDISSFEEDRWCLTRPAVNLSDGDKDIIINFALSKVGKKYDWLGILGFAIDRDIDNPNRYFCSEFVSKAFSLKYPLIPRKPSGLIPPELIYQSWRVVPVASNFLKI